MSRPRKAKPVLMRHETRHHGRVVQYDPATPDVDQGVRGTEIDGHVTAQKRQRVAHEERDLPRWVLLGVLCQKRSSDPPPGETERGLCDSSASARLPKRGQERRS